MPSKVVSTRGVSGGTFTLKEAILSSQPQDKGLFTFTDFPNIAVEDQENFVSDRYVDLAKKILGRFEFEIPEEELGQIIESAYGTQWDTPDVTPVSQLSENEYLLELYHGPTQAFKDVALQFLPRILSYYREKGAHLCALGASSGDTISAAHFGVGNVEGLASIFLLPKNGPSQIQRLQAVAHGFPNAMTILIDGNFDDGQKVIKEILTNPKYAQFREENNFITFNSINIARILAQIVYYFYAYFELVRNAVIDSGDVVNFSVPSGNFGDALAGVYAREMGLPINTINVATNKNSVLHDFLETGVYRPGEELHITLAPSQDITVASNFERMVYLVVKDPKRVAELMTDLSQNGSFHVTGKELSAFKEVLTSTTADDSAITETIQNVYSESKKVIDPHTATGVYGSRVVFDGSDIPCICLATADHIKFVQPEGVPRDKEKDQRILDSLSQNPVQFIESKADEESVVVAVREATKVVI